MFPPFVLNVLELAALYLDRLSEERIVELTGRNAATVVLWKKQGRVPIESLQKLIDGEPAMVPGWTAPTASEITGAPPAASNDDPKQAAASGVKLAILLCANKPAENHTNESLAAMIDNKTMRLKTFDFNNIYVVRNRAAQWFITQGYEWSFWPDYDMVFQHGNPDQFNEMTGADYPKNFAALNTILRLLVHKKTMVGSVYRRKGIGLGWEFAGGQSQSLIAALKSGPTAALQPTDWFGFGGPLVHRDVFLDIIKTQGAETQIKDPAVRNQLGYTHNFFWPNADGLGDDISFCARARRAGHQPFVDLAVMPGHIGRKCWTFRDA